MTPIVTSFLPCPIAIATLSCLNRLANLKDGKEYDNLYHADKARSEADWLVGINGTQTLTIAVGRGTYSVGRVQTPTLGMVCERYWENNHFVSKPL